MYMHISSLVNIAPSFIDYSSLNVASVFSIIFCIRTYLCIYSYNYILATYPWGHRHRTSPTMSAWFKVQGQKPDNFQFRIFIKISAIKNYWKFGGPNQ